MESVFNPFGKPFNELTEADLQVLKNISEGWYIEYKKEKQNAKDIAKSISSFANSYGGLYFLGIEHDPKTNAAKNICGVDNLPDIIGDAVRGNIQPVPYFQTFSIPLATSKFVILVAVSEGENTPYLHSSGKIYRRQDAASEPIISEMNRYAIDMLYSKAEGYRKKLDEFRQIDYQFCDLELKPHLAVFINTKPFNHFSIPDLLLASKFPEILSGFSEKYIIKEEIKGAEIVFSGNVSFDTLSTYHNSISMRQRMQKNLKCNGLTIEIDMNGNAKMLIPFNETSHDADKTELGKRYQSVLQNYDIHTVHELIYLNGRDILGAVMGLFTKYSRFLSYYGYKNNLEIKCSLINCHYTTLYFPNEPFIKHIEKVGIPVCMKDMQTFPEKPFELKREGFEKPITILLPIFSLICMALGVPSDIAILSVLEQIRAPDN